MIVTIPLLDLLMISINFACLSMAAKGLFNMAPATLLPPPSSQTSPPAVLNF